MDDLIHMNELKQQGFLCSQIVMILGLELQGKDNPDLIRAMQGLAGGLGFTGETCGALTGGACLLGLYAGRGRARDVAEPRLDLMVDELVAWFKDGYGKEYGNGSIRCDDILAGKPQYMFTRCPTMVSGTFQEVKDLLVRYGFDLAGNQDDE